MNETSPTDVQFGPEQLPNPAADSSSLQLLQIDAPPFAGATSCTDTSNGSPEPLPGSLVSDTGEVWTPPARPPIVEREKPKRDRKKSGDPMKPGRASWIWGTKLTFFERRKEAWLKAAEGKTSGDFYMKMAKLFFAKYGFDLLDNQDFEFDVVDPPDWVADKVVNVKLSQEEIKRRQQCYSKLKEVCCSALWEYVS
jgi:hypothetical protein